LTRIAACRSFRGDYALDEHYDRRTEREKSETLDRLLHELDSDWRTHAGFLSHQEAADLETEVERSFEDLDDAFDERGDGIDEQLSEES
jgi:hypothetical protein